MLATQQRRRNDQQAAKGLSKQVIGKDKDDEKQPSIVCEGRRASADWLQVQTCCHNECWKQSLNETGLSRLRNHHLTPLPRAKACGSALQS